LDNGSAGLSLAFSHAYELWDGHIGDIASQMYWGRWYGLASSDQWFTRLTLA
jgi:hypothetical protein